MRGGRRGRAEEGSSARAGPIGRRRALGGRRLRDRNAQRALSFVHWQHDPVSGRDRWSEEAYRLLGYRPGEVEPSFSLLEPMIHPGDRAAIHQALRRTVTEGVPYRAVFRIRTALGRQRLLEAHGWREYSPGGAVTVAGVARDISEERRYREALEHHRRQFCLLASAIRDVLWVGTPGLTRLHYVSPAVEALAGRSREELYRNPRAFVEQVHPDDRPRVQDLLDRRVTRHRLGFRLFRPDGELRWVESRVFPAGPGEGGEELVAGVVSDITDRARAEQALRRALDALEQAREEAERGKGRLEQSNRTLRRLSYQDPLTGVANRRSFDTYLAAEWRREARHHRPISVLLIDVDYFKAYNELYGHVQGDHCLRQVAAALADGLERGGDLVARYGGEEFVVVLPETPLPGARAMAEALRRRVARLRLPHAGSAVAPHLTVSIGVACTVPWQSSPRCLVQRADEALYLAKGSGRNRVATG